VDDAHAVPTDDTTSTASGDESAVATRAGVSTRGVVIVLACVLTVLALDQLTKWWAVTTLASGPIDVFGSTVQFALARNSGSAFSLFQGFTPVLAVVAVIIIVVLIRMLRSASDRWTILGLALVLGGALGNLVDRLFRSPGFLRGEVIDFISVGWWPTFNIADAALTVGVVLIIVRSFWRHD
jgi:signal peptidase II